MARKVLVATLGAAAVNYVTACGSGKLAGPEPADAGSDVVSSGNLMGPVCPSPDCPDPADTGAPLDAWTDAVSSGNLMGPQPPEDAASDAPADVAADGLPSQADGGDGGG